MTHFFFHYAHFDSPSGHLLPMNLSANAFCHPLLPILYDDPILYSPTRHFLLSQSPRGPAQNHF